MHNFPDLHNIPQCVEYKQLSGTNGINRAPQAQCQIQANNDYQAILAWLNEYQSSDNTYNHYQSQAERFLLWCLYARQTPLSSLKREDFDAYFNFLDNPQPSEIWCGGRTPRPRGTPGWKPFIGPLSHSSKQNAMRIINSLITYLVAVRYLDHNPIVGYRKLAEKMPTGDAARILIQERLLLPEEWYAMLDTLSKWHLINQTPNSHPKQLQENKARLELLVMILYYLGLRINELLTHNWSDFKQINNKWWFIVVGKGNKLAKVPVNSELLTIIKKYRQLIYPYWPAEPNNEQCPIIQNWNTGKAITTRTANYLLKDLAKQTIAMHFSHLPENNNTILKLNKFSAHWLRHLSATMQDRAGIKEKYIQANLRHDKAETTQHYIGIYDDERHAEIESKFKSILD